MITGGNKFRIITDHLGSPRLVVRTDTGVVVQRLDYSTLGLVTADSSPGFQPYAFAGGIHDPHTLMVKFGARDYDPRSTGRWMSKDPVLFDSGDTNLYGYALNDPINFYDYEGTTAMTDAGGQGGAMIGPMGAVVLGPLGAAMAKGGKQNVCDSGLKDIPDAEIKRRARDKSLSGEERRRYQKEEKARGLRHNPQN